MHGLHLVERELVRGRERMHLRAPQRLVRVDVAHAGDGALVEQRCLDRCATVRQPVREVVRAVCAVERLAPDTRVDVRVHFGRLEQEPGSEAPDVAVGDVRPVV